MEFTTDTGVEVKINPANFALADKLRKQVVRELKNINIDIPEKSLKNKPKSEIINVIINSLLTLDASDELQSIIFQCLTNCTYNREKIIYDTFEDMDARGYYYQIIGGCLQVNLTPFFKNLFAELSEFTSKISSFLKSKSMKNLRS